jgi:hypothetical protein
MREGCCRRSSIMTLAGMVFLGTVASPLAAQAQPGLQDCLAPTPVTSGKKMVSAVQKRVNDCREARSTLLKSALAPTTEASLKGMELTEKQKADELPAFPLGGSNWSLTAAAFLGLTRVTFGDSKAGTTDQFAALSGIGSGVKLRYSYVDANDDIHELIGLSGGLYFEPKVPVSGPGGSSSTAQTLSAMLVLSTFQYFYVGAGWKFASNEPAYDRGLALRNFMIVFSLGADGKSLTN